MWPGNTADVTSTIPVVTRLKKRFGANSFCIVADRGMSQRVDPTVWQAMVARLSERCRQGAVESGVMQTVSEVSALLAQHFPLRVGEHNPNELPDFPDTGRR
jgi:uncharacterized membrane protein